MANGDWRHALLLASRHSLLAIRPSSKEQQIRLMAIPEVAPFPDYLD
jgi:hypothetical protein